jgi:hypothetical protein
LDTGGVTNYYPGSRQKMLLRYIYNFGNLLQYVFTAEKDAGEQFFKREQRMALISIQCIFFSGILG